ncbi:MAG: glycosyltransferase family 4 protein [Bacteroidales bacterium]|nr:glycosyltransferase family 4 protein [Bacteroidales bacterium]
MKILLTSTIPLSLNVFCRGWLKNLKRSGYEVVAVSSPGKDLEAIRMREGVRTHAVKMYRYITPLRDFKSLRRLIKVFRMERPQMVHSITPKAGLLSMMAAWMTRVPVRVHTFTGLVFPTATGLRRLILATTDRLTCLFATHIIPEGNGVKSDLQRYHITRKPLRVLGYGNLRGVDLKYYNPDDPGVCAAAEPLKKDGIFTFVFIGRMVGDKGVNELVEAFRILNQECADTRLLLIGWEAETDPLKPETEDEISRNPAIEYVGYQADVRPWLVASDVLVLPSYREGFPNVVLEAGAMGLPAIVTDINGSNEIISEGVNGMIVPPKDCRLLYEAMKNMYGFKDKLFGMGKRARGIIAERFEQSYVRYCIKEYYREILGA